MGVKRIAAALLVVGLLAIPVGAQYGWFTLDGGLIARLSSSTTAVTIRQDGSGAVLDLYAGSTRIFRAISTGFSWALAQTIDVASIGTTSTDGMRVRNQTAAAAGAQQYSPRTCWEGQGWKTDATAASQSVVFCLETQPVQGTSAPTGNLILKASINGGAFSTVGTFTSAGNLTVPGDGTFNGSLLFGTNITSSAGGYIHNTLRSGFTSPVDGTFRIQNWNFDNYLDVLTAAWGTTLSAEGVSVADAAVLSGPASGVGTLTVSIGTDNDVCVFALTGTDAPVELTDSGTLCTITKDNASTVNVYYDTDGYKVQNNRGGARTLRILFIGG